MIKKYISKYNNLALPAKAALWYTVCNVLNKGIALLSTPIFTRILTEEQYGTFSVFQSWYAIFIIFTSLNMFMGGYTKGLMIYKDRRDEFTSSLLSLTTIITCVFAMLYAFNIELCTSIFQIPPVLMVAMFLELLFMPAVEFWSARERFDYKYKKFVAVSFFMNLSALTLAVIAVLLSEHKIEAKIYSDVIAKVSFCIVIFAVIFVKGKCFYNKEYWLYSLKFNMPLIPHYLSNYVLNQSDRLMISRMVGNAQAAFYSIAYTISTMMTLVVTAVNNALTPYIYKSIESKNYDGIKKSTSLIFVFIATLCILTMAFAPEVILIFAGRDYMEAIYVIPPVAASVFFIFLYAMFSTVEYYFQETKLIAFATVVCAIANIVLNYIGISIWGYYAAGYTTLICYIELALLHYVFYKKIIKVKMPEVDDLYNLKIIIITSLIVISAMLVMSFTYRYSVIRYLIIVIMLLVAVIKRKYIFSLIKRVNL